MPFQQITIIGTGLIGGSFGLAGKAAGFKGPIVGSDRRPVLDRALERGAIDAGGKGTLAGGAGRSPHLLAAPPRGNSAFTERIGAGVLPRVPVPVSGSH